MIKVTLRKKTISKGRESLYLDFYPEVPHPDTGALTRREFLKLYVVAKPKTPLQRRSQKETLQLAEAIRQKRANRVNKPEIYTEAEKEKLRQKELGERDFISYFKQLANKRYGSNYNNWTSTYKHLNRFANGILKFKDLDERILERFKDYLLKTIAQNSAASYFNKVKATLRQAQRDGILQTDLNAKVSPINQVETRREHLTIDELNELVQTPCGNDVLKRAALFSTLTGLRFSDIEKLKWSEVEHVEGQGYFLNFSQQKTKAVEILPISKQAVSLMGRRLEDQAFSGVSLMGRRLEDKAFSGLKYSAWENKQLFQWIRAAGITKEITFHCFRHTFATLQLFNGTDIFTVSKMLGHKDLKTTQVYAKVVDLTKRKASEKIQLAI